MEIGLEVSDIDLVVEYEAKAIFKDFVLTMTELRRRGDRDGGSASLIAALAKLKANSSYGKVIK